MKLKKIKLLQKKWTKNRNQKKKDWNWNTNNKEGQTIIFRGREKRRKKNMSATNQTTTIDIRRFSKKRTWCHSQRYDKKEFVNVGRRCTHRPKGVRASDMLGSAPYISPKGCWRLPYSPHLFVYFYIFDQISNFP